MRKIFLTLILLCQVNPAFSYNENTLAEKLFSLHTTFQLQSDNAFSEADKMNKLAKDPDAKPEQLYMLYVTTSQSMCISALALEKMQNLIEENPQVIGSILTREDIKTVDDTVNVFEKYLKEFELDNQQCKHQMPAVYESINNP